MKKGLVVDDEKKNRDTVKTFLLLRGYKVTEAENGMEALKVLKNDKEFDVIFSDVEMPNMTGFELLARVKRDNTVKHIPVIILTSLNDPAHIDKAKKLGSSAYIVKPLNRDKITTAFKEAGL